MLTPLCMQQLFKNSNFNCFGSIPKIQTTTFPQLLRIDFEDQTTKLITQMKIIYRIFFFYILVDQSDLG